ncbi:putative GMC oxidoreductase family protein [Teratosphaeria destructans]|uniref:GMC oxidoreductase family protein n=1 Tax=Teratosphaeria destructans TaxID=418781 RepID=A0A9W7SK55_9PEZI|nr:putative GMC oxidoreductase family protein [Teratosphaeria destructans]
MSNTVALPAADFVICGGGTAGLVLAARLSEAPSVSVAVIEAGGDHSHDINVLAPGLLTSLYGNPEYDWGYESVPQAYMNGTVIDYPRGKQLGGSSAINYLAWTHASPRNIDNWGYLGNENWSWAELEPYYRKSENFSMPNATVVSDLDLHWLKDSAHGKQGPVRNAYPHEWTLLDQAWPLTYDRLGLGMIMDERDGLALGGYDIQTNINLDNNTRSYAATAYLNPVRYRKNLKVYTNALVRKVNFDHGIGVQPVARSVDLEMNGTAHSIAANREIILSAGAIGSPQILELSGVGNKTLLSSLGIETVVENPGVGENFQDHWLMNVGFEVVSGIFTTDDLANETIYNASYTEYVANKTGPLSWVSLGGGFLSAQQILPNIELGHFLENISASVSSIQSNALQPDPQSALILRDIYEGHELAQHMNIVGGVNPLSENAAAPAQHGFTMQVCAEHLFSRGSTHVRSKNASVYPVIDPNIFSHPADLEILSKIALQAQNVIARSPPLSDHLQGNGTVLGPLYTNLTEANAGSIVRKEAESVSHPSGTCSMLPPNAGGVVDPRFRVYGTRGLRVVDASTFPLIPRGNLQSCVYAVAERAADFVKEEHGLPW